MTIACLSYFCNSRIFGNLIGFTGLLKVTSYGIDTALAIAFKKITAFIADTIATFRTTTRDSFRTGISADSTKSLCHVTSSSRYYFSLFFHISGKVYYNLVLVLLICFDVYYFGESLYNENDMRELTF